MVRSRTGTDCLLVNQPRFQIINQERAAPRLVCFDDLTYGSKSGRPVWFQMCALSVALIQK